MTPPGGRKTNRPAKGSGAPGRVRKRTPAKSGSPRLIGLTGTNAAGKGEAARFFQSEGYAYFSLSDEIREELLKAGREPTRDNMIRTGNELRERGGADVLARRVLARVWGRAVIDSIRNPREIECLRTRKGFFLLAVDAPIDIRFRRAAARGRDESAADLAGFRAKEDEERSDSETGQQLDECLKMADALVINDGTLEEFRRKLEKFL